MEKKSAELVYQRLMGFCEQPMPGVAVENLFAEGADGDRLYEEIYGARLRICQRLGVEEDQDLGLMMDCFDQMIRLVAEKMFECGACAARQE